MNIAKKIVGERNDTKTITEKLGGVESAFNDFKQTAIDYESHLDAVRKEAEAYAEKIRSDADDYASKKIAEADAYMDEVKAGMDGILRALGTFGKEYKIFSDLMGKKHTEDIPVNEVPDNNMEDAAESVEIPEEEVSEAEVLVDNSEEMVPDTSVSTEDPISTPD